MMINAGTVDDDPMYSLNWSCPMNAICLLVGTCRGSIPSSVGDPPQHNQHPQVFGMRVRPPLAKQQRSSAASTLQTIESGTLAIRPSTRIPQDIAPKTGWSRGTCLFILPTMLVQIQKQAQAHRTGDGLAGLPPASPSFSLDVGKALSAHPRASPWGIPNA